MSRSPDVRCSTAPRRSATRSCRAGRSTRPTTRDLTSNPPGRVDEVQRCVLHARTNNYDVFCTHLVWRYDEGYIRETRSRRARRLRARPRRRPTPPSRRSSPATSTPNPTQPRSGSSRADTRSTGAARGTRTRGAWPPGKGDGFTWDNRNTNAAAEREPDRRIDYIFSGWDPERPKGAGRIAFSAVVCDRALTGAFASDHFGLFAEIETP